MTMSARRCSDPCLFEHSLTGRASEKLSNPALDMFFFTILQQMWAERDTAVVGENSFDRRIAVTQFVDQPVAIRTLAGLKLREESPPPASFTLSRFMLKRSSVTRRHAVSHRSTVSL